MADVPYNKALIYSWGTRGDVQPSLALALKLKELGKDVHMFVTPPSDTLVTNAGIKCTAAKENIENLLNAIGQTDPADMSPSGVRKTLKILSEYENSDAYKAAIHADTVAGFELAMSFKPDVILCAGFEYAVWASCGEALQVPVIRYDLQPNYPTTEIGFFKLEYDTLPCGCMKYYAYKAFNSQAIGKKQRPRAMELRKLLGLSLSQHADGSALTLPPDLPELCIMSPAFVPQPSDWPAFKEMNGYWMMPPSEYTPSKELASFLSSGDAPVYIGFGSMKGNPEFCKRLSTMAITALAHAERRGILLGGWAGLTAQVLDVSTEDGRRLQSYAAANIFELPSCPHDWLFSRCSAVVHHGGAGTTSAGLHAGVPTIICATIGDQPWHGSLIAKRKLGLYAGKVSKVQGEKLGDMLKQVLADAEIHRNVQEISRKLKEEDGALNTHRCIQRVITTFKFPWPTRSVRG